MSFVRTGAAILRPNLAKFAGVDGAIGPAGDPALASRLAEFVDAAYNALGSYFAASIANDIELQMEGFAAFRYFLGSNADKASVEAQRLTYLGSKCAACPASSG